MRGNNVKISFPMKFRFNYADNNCNCDYNI